jgi:DNA polymerase V
MGAPGFKYEGLIRKNEGVLLSSNYALYGDMSSRVMEVLNQFSPEVEIYSIDEAFLKFNDLPISNLEEYGRQIKHIVKKHTGIPVSVGISRSKTLAKIANYYAKHFEGYRGCVSLMENEKIEKALRQTPI